MIIPFFIPHAGCPHQCVFCNQKNITGQKSRELVSGLPEKISAYCAANRSQGPVEIALYGGTFTALPRELQKSYLEAARPFIRSGMVRGIRLSTRPDCIDDPVLDLLWEYHVTTVELGAQSLDNKVLACSGRGHTADEHKACR